MEDSGYYQAENWADAKKGDCLVWHRGEFLPGVCIALAGKPVPNVALVRLQGHGKTWKVYDLAELRFSGDTTGHQH